MEWLNLIGAWVLGFITWIFGFDLGPEYTDHIKTITGTISVITGTLAVSKLILLWRYRRTGFPEIVRPVLRPALDIFENYDKFQRSISITPLMEERTKKEHEELQKRPDVVIMRGGRPVTDPQELIVAWKEELQTSIAQKEELFFNEAADELEATIDSLRATRETLDKVLRDLNLAGHVAPAILKSAQAVRALLGEKDMRLNTIVNQVFPLKTRDAESFVKYKPVDLRKLAIAFFSFAYQCNLYGNEMKQEYPEAVNNLIDRNPPHRQQERYDAFKAWARSRGRH